MMKKLMHILFLSCLKATELIEKKLYFRLSVKEKMQLIMHKMMCEACANYEKQSIFLDHAMHRIEKPEEITVDLGALKNDICNNIEESK